jgi:hypothetical protein
MSNVWMGGCARSRGEEDGIYPYLVSHRLQARALLRA